MKTLSPTLLLLGALSCGAAQAQTLDTRAQFDRQAGVTRFQLEARGPAQGVLALLFSHRLQQPIQLAPFGLLHLDPSAILTANLIQLDAVGRAVIPFQVSWATQPDFTLVMQAAYVDILQGGRIGLGEAVSLTHRIALTPVGSIPTTLVYKPVGAAGHPVISYRVSLRAGDTVTVTRCRGGVETVLSTVRAPTDGDLFGGVPNPDVASGDVIKLKVNGIEVARTTIP
jgi:hypothetical protein